MPLHAPILLALPVLAPLLFTFRRREAEIDLSGLDRVLAQLPTLTDVEVDALRDVLAYLDGCSVPAHLLGAIARLRTVLGRAPEA